MSERNADRAVAISPADAAPPSDETSCQERQRPRATRVNDTQGMRTVDADAPNDVDDAGIGGTASISTSLLHIHAHEPRGH